MKIIVQKYGGSSLATAEKIKNIAKRIVASQRRAKTSLVIVVSAMGTTTNRLINLANTLSKSPQGRELDRLLSTGEEVSSSLLALAIKSLGKPALSLTGAEAGIITDQIHTKAKILLIDPRRIKRELKRGKIVIVAGFQGISQKGEITTLGRGASDLSAVALAKSLNAKRCEIFSDVKGICTTDPAIVKEAKKIPSISYDEVLEIAGCGAQVMHGRSVELAKKFRVPLLVGSSFSKEKGTIIKDKTSVEAPCVSGVTLNEKEVKISIFRVLDRPGIAAKIFGSIAKNGINVDMIVQNVSKEGYTDLSFTVSIDNLEETVKVTKRIALVIGAGKVSFDKDIARVSIIGLGMQSHPGIAARMFSVLAKNRINIKMITTSEIKISTVVPKKDGKKSLRAVHKEFIE
ncbi:MAG: aspartate kinase [bacterium (Candidatus Ratteibacteria) CG_4_9_14_3_um_filter_41_21]|uniref:Aspartokinase n=4 Tax=Candidatus Ratteibacteria TaxID=2979319 RepID=A0A2M7YEF4_9BACT|nr:MAG: aspartate kinase [bacterium (Candidatus Ratteibacteria) CG01_land_8_20_14_3_00_40_19]PIW33820.1 MAG: aspartate kinase [bacterium (Candidatus Ratteibacteria) CG15_BIG_FIL_POST_REV_8_21_14_020_41_12]PJA61365.1 MAG: aspartate kinase [bacterium (Candidatus Ratteibacteria) CG_4_9_14_3_um_filter_41_21]HCG76763.1 aspartate kinase [bacterium]